MSIEAFWIVPLRPSRSRVLGPYGTLDEAREAGDKVRVAAHVIKTTIGDKQTLEVVDFIKSKYAV